MESPIKIKDELEKAQSMEPEKRVATVSSPTDSIVKAIILFLFLVSLFVVVFLYFWGEKMGESVKVDTVKTSSEKKKDNPENNEGFKRTTAKSLFYTNRGFGFQLTLDEKRKNYKAVIEEDKTGTHTADLNLYFETSSPGEANMPGYEKVLGIHIYTKNAWQSYEANCSSIDGCSERKVGENNLYVFAVSKPDKRTDEELDRILNSLKTINPGQSEGSSGSSGGSESQNDKTDKTNTNSSSNEEDDDENKEQPSNSNTNNKNTNSNPPVIKKDNCTYPSGNIATWWSTASDKQRACFISTHGTPEFGNEEPYFCDYSDSNQCLPTQ